MRKYTENMNKIIKQLGLKKLVDNLKIAEYIFFEQTWYSHQDRSYSHLQNKS